MPERLEEFLLRQVPTAERPLQGQSILVVEDSRFASESLRLMGLRSGARVRRADSLAAAARHLASYRPSIVVVDLGLPDGSGTALIAKLKIAEPSAPVVLAVSGDAGAADRAAEVGADGFLLKPIGSLASFQEAVLAALSPEERPRGPRLVPVEPVRADRLAFQEDLSLAARALNEQSAPDRLSYIAQFLSGVAMSAGDRPLEEAARTLGSGGTRKETIRRLRNLLKERLAARAVV